MESLLDLNDFPTIITSHGDTELWKLFEVQLTHDLRHVNETIKKKTVPINKYHVKLIAYDRQTLPDKHTWNYTEQPILHVYWTECPDVDQYKDTAKCSIDKWLSELNERKQTNWLIVAIESLDAKRANKLLQRTSVLDKIRADFAAKGNRCISISNPKSPKIDFTATESYKSLVNKFRAFLDAAYLTVVDLMKEIVSKERDGCAQPDWDFRSYFEKQEELAMIYELTGAYKTALLQYDQIDATLSHAITNVSITGKIVTWLLKFAAPIDQWPQITITGPITKQNRRYILDTCFDSLLLLRGYLFTKQSALLLQMNHVEEMTKRALPYFYRVVHELQTLHNTIPPGALACWLLLACIDIVETAICQTNASAQTITGRMFKFHLANLHNYARQKLDEVGVLCGLMSENAPTSEQLHLVVVLSSGMGDYSKLDALTPTDRLKKILRYKETFIEYYLEQTKTAINLYEKNNFTRHAKQVKYELSDFLIRINDCDIAVAYLRDVIKHYECDRWLEMMSSCYLQLAPLYKTSHKYVEYVDACVKIAASTHLDAIDRNIYFDGMLRHANDDITVKQIASNAICVHAVIADGMYVENQTITLRVCFECNFPREVLCRKICVTLKRVDGLVARRSDDVRLKFVEFLNLQQDGTVGTANVACTEPEPNRLPSLTIEQNPSAIFHALNVSLKPGLNEVNVSDSSLTCGFYTFVNVTAYVGNIEFITLLGSRNDAFEVKKDNPVLTIVAEQLIAGIRQQIEVVLKNGSSLMKKNHVILSSGSVRLRIPNDEMNDFSDHVTIEVPELSYYETISYMVEVFCELNNTQDDHIKVPLDVVCSWKKDATKQTKMLCFTPLFKSSWRLHTSMEKKFLQISLVGVGNREIVLTNPRLLVGINNVKLLNSCVECQIKNNLKMSYIWEITPRESLDATFQITYHMPGACANTFTQHIQLDRFQTIFVMRLTVESARGGEFCRLGTMCHLNIVIERVSNDGDKCLLMYEVLDDKETWAVCGPPTGVVTFDGHDTKSIVLDLMPLNSGHMPMPCVRLSKYIPAGSKIHDPRQKTEQRVQQFGKGEIYNAAKTQQVHVLLPANESLFE